jgi:hypothetical protein
VWTAGSEERRERTVSTMTGIRERETPDRVEVAEPDFVPTQPSVGDSPERFRREPESDLEPTIVLGRE